ncbi:hypothetical protein [Methanotorris formicicus]|uniref:hypothetical protein n=1 Tax=Methanotorris formicicus TaxID=213185 RepID=UPI0011452680|nr:hypothetical protein [Methanotorris formicicus]
MEKICNNTYEIDGFILGIEKINLKNNKVVEVDVNINPIEFGFNGREIVLIGINLSSNDYYLYKFNGKNFERIFKLSKEKDNYNSLDFIQSEDYWKMQEEIKEYNDKVVRWFILVLVLIFGMILFTLCIIRKDKFLLFLAIFGLIIPFLQFEIPNWLFNILAFPLFVYVKFIVPKNAGGSIYYSPLITIPISMYGWILIGLVIKIFRYYLKKYFK